MMRVFRILAVLGLVEIFLFAWVGSWLGPWLTVLLVMVAAIAGLGLLRWQISETLWQIQARLNSGQWPQAQMLDGVFLALGGLLLLIPGFLTDLLALSLALPWTRSLWRRWLLGARPSSQNGITIEGECRRK